MFVVMHCGGLSFNGQTIKESSLGGSESAAYYMARELAAQGHAVTLFTNSTETGTFDGVKYEWCGNVTDDYPLGDRFSFYAENTPHDICIIQRHPRAFERKLASKLNFLWLHDLALYRTRDLILGQMWNVDQVLCVSEWHKEQVCKVYGIDKDIVSVVRNGIDLDLYNCEPMQLVDLGKDGNTLHLFYSSRPERGLLNLVGPNGIMEKLKDDNVHLHVCGYENTTPQMKTMYEYLWARCDELPNVTNHGALSKQELAELQTACDVWVYPTEFEEVSCITAMEAMAAGCSIIASAVAALPETCKDVSLIPLKDGAADIDAFVTRLRCLQLKSAPNYNLWSASAEVICETARRIFATAHPTSLMHHFLRHSDIKAFESAKLSPDGSAFVTEMLTEYNAAYGFYREDSYAKHYADFYQYEKDRGINYGAEDVTGTTRFQAVANTVALLPEGSRVLDYGCAHGHYTVALAKRFPHLNFTGADIAQSNLDTAEAWAEDEGLCNISFLKVDGAQDIYAQYDLIIAAEVIEHVGNPQEYVDTLANSLTVNGMMVLTVPYGAWEAQGYREHGYWRAHLHHFERADLLEMLGHHPNYKVVAAPSGISKFHSALGSYIVTFGKPTEPSRAINYTRKLMQTMPDQTVTCCMIVKDAEADILRCLRSVLPHVQEVIVGVDCTSTDATMESLRSLERTNPLVAFRIFDLASVTETGFAAARNETLKYATCDWVLWIDADEFVTHGDEMARYLRHSMYNGFAVRQHHFSHDPVGIIKVDMPCRLFRNRLGIQFFGAVHEHPELKLNEGVGAVSTMPNMSIVHHGYVDETVRRKRFSRNLPLLQRDRAEQPDRLLGKFLWLRDLAQSCQYDMEDGSMDKTIFAQRIDEGLSLWRELMASKNYRLVLDALPFYSQLALLRGNGVDFSFAVDASLVGESNALKQTHVQGYFNSSEDALQLMNALAEGKIGDQDRRYL